MEWVVTTGKTVDEAKDRALDQLGVAADEAEFEVVEEAKTGLFGRVKAEAQVRARVRPAQVRPKHDRRERRRSKGRRDESRKKGNAQDASASSNQAPSNGRDGGSGDADVDTRTKDSSDDRPNGQAGRTRQRSQRQRQQKESSAMNGESQSDVTPQEVGEAAVAFMDGLTDAFGLRGASELTVEGTDLDVQVTGDELGLLVGPGGRTLTAVQDLVRVAAQRRLGDHDTRLRIDVGGYREKRRAALERFAQAVANDVIDQGEAKALEPMSSSDRKAVHDALTDIEGVTSRSEGDDPNRRVVISPE
jgi:spoIIIJ-associated protein